MATQFGLTFLELRAPALLASLLLVSNCGTSESKTSGAQAGNGSSGSAPVAGAANGGSSEAGAPTGGAAGSAAGASPSGGGGTGGASHPLTDVSVADFGAHPGDGLDDLPALVRAAAALQSNQRLSFEAGEYDLDLDGPTQTLSFWGKDALEIAGNGATLLLRHFDVTHASKLGGGLFSFGDCNGVKLHDLDIDMDRPPFSQGTVDSVAADQHSFVFTADEGYKVTPAIKIEAMLSYDPKTGLPDGATFDRYYSEAPANYAVAAVAGKPQSLQISVDSSGLSAGDRLVIRHAIYEYNAIGAQNCAGLDIARVTVATVPGMGFYAEGSNGVSVQHFQISMPPGSKRLMSTTADGIHLSWTRGDVVIDQSTLEGMGDDGLNLHTVWLNLSAIDTAHATIQTATHTGGGYVAFAPGDQVEFADSQLQFKGTALVQAGTVAKLGDATQSLVLDALPAGIGKDWVVVNSSRIPSSIKVTNTAVRGNRARGALLQSRHVLLDGCTFQNDTAAAIHVTTDINTWYEALGARDVTIQNCTIDGVNAGAVSGAAAIYVFAELPTGTPYVGIDAPSGVHRNITIANNKISNTPESAVYIGSSQTVSVTGNQLSNVSSKPTKPNGAYPVYVKNSDSVRVENNTLTASPSAKGLGQDGSSNVTASQNGF